MDTSKKVVRGTFVFIWTVILLAVLYTPLLLEQEAPYSAITIFCWPDAFDGEVLEQFERETGIKVFLRFYESNEELLVKVRATKGEGYDLIMPSDYAVAQLIKEDLVQKIDKEQVHFFSRLEPFLTGHYYDPNNDYSLPFEWGIYGIGVDKNAFKDHVIPASWSLIFPRQGLEKHLVMVDDPREAVSLAANYLFGQDAYLGTSQIDAIQKLLIRQRPYVQAYTSLRPDYFLATQNASVVVCPATYVARAIRKYADVDFIIPQEGTFITIENLALPISSKKSELAYKFLNFIYRSEIMLKNYEAFIQFPTTSDALQLASAIDQPYNMPLKIAVASVKKISFFRHDIADSMLNTIWIAVKTA